VKQRLAGERIAALGTAILLAVLASAIYRSFVFSEFPPIRIGVVGAEQTASRRIVTIALPDLSELRGHTAVLTFLLRNRDAEPRRIGLSGDGLPTSRVAVPPHRTIRWDIVFSPEAVQALQARAGDGARTLELTGDADVWDVMAFEIRNYHVRWGDRVMAVVLPTRADRYTPATGFLPVAIGLCVLALLNAQVSSKPQRRAFRLFGNALAFTAFLVCLICLILPRMSSYRLLLSPSAFWLVAAGLFARALLDPLHAPRTLVARMQPIVPIVARGWKRHEVTFERGAALLGLAAIAIAQPIFEVVSNSPEFFPARSTPPASIVAAVLAICLGIPLMLLGVERAIRAVSRSAATTVHGMVVAFLSAALVMPWLRRIEFLTLPWNAGVGAFIGIATAFACSRMPAARQFLTALAPAALVVPTLFLFDPGVTQSLLPSESAAAVQSIEQTPPIVLVVFDELPMNSLLTAGGNIDAERYPNFGALAREAYWFRNASTVAYNTIDAVPAILSGRYATTDRAVPTLRYYPVNLFTALARHYDIFASMRFKQLCPPRACQQNSAIPADTVRSLVTDLGLVWLHIVLPRELTEDLPPVVGEWAEFVRTRETPMAGMTGRRGVFARFASAIDDRPARLYFIHLVLPHMQFEYVPSGRRYRGPDYQTTMYRGKGLFEGVSAAYADTLHQRHLAQVGFVDRLVGDLIGRLREVGAYDKALVIITADHGASYREARSRRRPQPEQHNLSDILQVPLFMKLPGQQHGEIVDRIVETVDVLPTILDILGASASLRLDGRSLIDDRAPERSPHTFFLRDTPNAAPRALGDLASDRLESLERKEHRFGKGDHMALYAPPGARHVLGMRVSQSAMHAAPDVQIRISNPRQFEAVKRDSDPLPLYVRGALSTSRPDPLRVAVVVNGIVAAVAQSYRERGGHMFGTLIPENVLRDGNNTVDAFVVDRF
jgi:Sulfatase